MISLFLLILAALYHSYGEKGTKIVGHFIRKRCFDEVPQLFNVLKGGMSLIAPRLEKMKLEEELIQENLCLSLCHTVVTGINGWVPVNYLSFGIQGQQFQLMAHFSMRAV